MFSLDLGRPISIRKNIKGIRQIPPNIKESMYYRWARLIGILIGRSRDNPKIWIKSEDLDPCEVRTDVYSTALKIIVALFYPFPFGRFLSLSFCF